MGIPKALASYERETTQPSLLERTTTGTFFKAGAKTRSQETKKLSQSNRKYILISPKTARNHAPNAKLVIGADHNGGVGVIGRY